MKYDKGIKGPLSLLKEKSHLSNVFVLNNSLRGKETNNEKKGDE